MAGTASISGIISGLDTASILDKLKTAASAPITRLQNQQTQIKNKLTAWQNVNTRLLAFKEQTSALALNTAFSGKTVTSSNEAILTATASASAGAGDYSFTVESLAKTHKITSQGYALDSALVGAGTVDITIGDGATVSIGTGADTTLADLRDKINHADAGVSAFIVNTGAGTTPYQLVVTSKTSGTKGAITLATNLGGGAAPTFTDVQAAADATIGLGNGLTVTRSSNTVSDIFPGLTLNLLSAKPGETVTVGVNYDSSGVKQKIQDFVSKYNDLVDYLQTQWSYDSDTEATGTLFGEYTLFEIQSRLSSQLTSGVAGIPSSDYSALSQAGIRMGTDGKLVLTESDLEQALSDNPDGVMRLFSRYATPDNAAVSFVSGTSDTQASGAAGYAVSVTRLATQARVTAGVAQSGALAQDETLTINNVAIRLTAGMTQDQVLAEINSKNAQTKVSATATDVNGSGSGQYLTLTSINYGSTVHIKAISGLSNGSGANSGLGSTQVTEANSGGEAGTGTGAAGIDIAGQINGEDAQGSGQILKAITGNAKGLWLNIKATVTGDYGKVVYTQGVAAELDQQLSFLTNGDNGSISLEEKSAQSKIDDLADSITRMQDTVQREQDRMEAEFNAMESALSTLKTQGDYLSNQLTALSKSS
jgi:flagellar hook-associated protein 2